MEQALSIWSPVVISELNNPQWCVGEQVYPVDQLFRFLEELKIKVKKSEALKQGQAVEVRLKVDILCLLQDQNGKIHLVKREDTIKERVAYTDFNRGLTKEDEVNFIINIKAVTWEGDLKGKEIRVKYFIEYNLIATREQIVKVWAGEQGEIKNDYISELFRQLKDEINRLTGENQELNRKIFFYERDISSLKRGIAKLEKHNAVLLKDINRYQQEAAGLRKSLEEKEEHIIRLKPDQESHYDIPYNVPKEDENELTIGRRIKRLFLNNML